MIYDLNIKKELLKRLKKHHAFWSYDVAKITVRNIPDEILIEKTFIHLDLEDIRLLFIHYKPGFIKKVWRERMAARGDYMRTLNKFIAWYYFDIKNPEKYLKTIETKYIKAYDKGCIAGYGKGF